VIEACRQSGVALADGLSANMLRNWINEAERGEAAGGSQITPTEPMTDFVPPRRPRSPGFGSR